MSVSFDALTGLDRVSAICMSNAVASLCSDKHQNENAKNGTRVDS